MKTRIRIIAGCVFLFAILLLVKLYSVQIIHSEDFRDRADRQYQRPANAFNRGTIYFTDKAGTKISAATLKTGFILAIIPKSLQRDASIDTTYNKLLEIVPTLNYEEYAAKANKIGDTYEEIAKRIDEEQGKKIAALKIPGVSLYKDKWRYYPGGELAAHVLGFMGYKGNEIGGRYGLERSYEENLKRENDDVYVNFFAELFSNIKKGVSGELQGDVVTSIEPRTQAYVEDMLKKLNGQYSSERSGAIVMDPNTGEIVSMALYPTFDPNNFQAASGPEVFRNDMVESVNEMGSIIKPLTMAVGIDLGKVHATTTYNDTGSVTSDGRTIYNFDKKGRRGVITLQYALSKSLNTGFAYVVQRTGNKAFTEYFKNFGFGTKTGIDLPNETQGLISNLQKGGDVASANAAFGQGIALTPIEAVRAFTALANDGKMVTPHIASSIVLSTGITKEIEVPAPVQVLSPEATATIATMMTHIVDKAMGGGIHKMEHYTIAGKTGTAQIAKESGGGYYTNKYLHSFFGFFPATNPKFLVFLFLRDPKGVDYASQTLIDPFFATAKFLLNYYNIPPDR